MGTPIQQRPVQYYQPVQQSPVQQYPVQQSPRQQTPGQVGQYPGQVGQYPTQQGYGQQNAAAAGALFGGLLTIGIGAFLGVAAVGLQAAAYCPPGRGGWQQGPPPGQYPGQTPNQFPGQFPGQVGQVGQYA